MLREQFPRAVRVRSRRAQMADRDTDDERAIDACVRQKHLAGSVHRVEEALVEAVEFGRSKTQRSRVCAKANDAKRHRRESFEVRMLINARGEFMSETDMPRQNTAEPRRTKMPKNHPKL